MTRLTWNASKTPTELHSLLKTLGETYPITEGAAKGAVVMEFAPGEVTGGLKITLDGSCATIAYARPHHAARAIGALLADLVKRGGQYSESLPFETFGIMLDCSRNAVMTVGHFKGWLRQLALLGYNMAMLYTEDTYELPGEPYFGYLRGRYSADDLRTIDACARSLNIEMIGCIQTLGHLEQILKRPAFAKVRDTGSVLLVDEPATYELIDKMLGQMASCYSTRRIHIGMDETHDLGRGIFMDRHGYERGYDIFNRHLAKVIELCRKHGLSPMIWSDMYFRMGSKKGGYYDKECAIPSDVKAAIPKACQLVYWDYYHEDADFYADWIGRHRELGFEPVMASGVWTWSSVWHNRDRTEKYATPCVQAARAAGLREFFFTLWGDDGAYCEFDSALAGLAYGAELAYTGSADTASLTKRFAAVCGADYRLVSKASDLNLVPHESQGLLLWDDPLLMIYYKSCLAKNPRFWTHAKVAYRGVAKALAASSKVTEPVDLNHAVNLANFLLAKIDFFDALAKAYRGRKPAQLRAVARQMSVVYRRLDALAESFRRQWLARNKPNGLDTLQIRMGGQKARWAELQRRLGDLAAGRITAIPELDEWPPKAYSRTEWRKRGRRGDHLVLQ